MTHHKQFIKQQKKEKAITIGISILGVLIIVGMFLYVYSI
jgi:hypothetical protein